MQDLPLKLARKCVDVFGASIIDASAAAAAAAHHTVDFAGCCDGEEAADLRAGADFALMVSGQGKLFYTGKSSAIGHKQPCPAGRWNEVAVSRSPKITQVTRVKSRGSRARPTTPTVIERTDTDTVGNCKIGFADIS